jgi:hypothetical protein
MVYPRRHNSQIPLLQSQSNPIVTFTSHIKVTCSIEYISDFLVFMQMFVKESFYFFFVVWQCGGGDGDFVAVFVVAGGGEVVYAVERGIVVADYAEVGEVRGGDWAAAVVGEALVALLCCVRGVGWRERRRGLLRCCRTSMPSWLLCGCLWWDV